MVVVAGIDATLVLDELLRVGGGADIRLVLEPNELAVDDSPFDGDRVDPSPLEGNVPGELVDPVRLDPGMLGDPTELDDGLDESGNKVDEREVSLVLSDELKLGDVDPPKLELLRLDVRGMVVNVLGLLNVVLDTLELGLQGSCSGVGFHGGVMGGLGL
jgi:hypothetical protein